LAQNNDDVKDWVWTAPDDRYFDYLMVWTAPDDQEYGLRQGTGWCGQRQMTKPGLGSLMTAHQARTHSKTE